MPDAADVVVTWTGTIHRNLTGELRHPCGDVIPITATVDGDGVMILAGTRPESHWRGAVTPDRKSFRLIARWGVEFIGSVAFSGGAYHLTATHTIWPAWMRLQDEEEEEPTPGAALTGRDAPGP